MFCTRELLPYAAALPAPETPLRGTLDGFDYDPLAPGLGYATTGFRLF